MAAVQEFEFEHAARVRAAQLSWALTDRDHRGAEMTEYSQVPWTEEQWARVNNAIQEEAARARVSATFLPMVGPLPPDTDFVRDEHVYDQSPLIIEDRTTIPLATLQVELSLRGAQMADPELTSALTLFRRAANGLARLEDAVVFNGLRPVQGAAPGGGVGCRSARRESACRRLARRGRPGKPRSLGRRREPHCSGRRGQRSSFGQKRI